jgi:predicted negative regulator of RcsB-dependent stress response
MKGSERHHLKDNELANLLSRAGRMAGEQRAVIVGVLAAALLGVLAALGYAWWQGRAERQAEALMAEALSVEEGSVEFPSEQERLEALIARYKTVADQYPSTDTGLFARYREAAALVAAGRPADALTAYQQVSDAAGDRLIGHAARLGAAEAHVQAGDYDAAVATYQAAAESADGPIPVEAVLLQLGRTYLRAGRSDDARQTFSRVVDEFPSSPLSSEAQHELSLLDAAG